MSGAAKTPISPKAVLAGLITLALCTVLLFFTIKNKSDVEQIAAEQMMAEKALNITDVISRLLYKTQTLAALVVASNGELAGFDRVASTIMDDPAILNLLVAPGGVVSDVYPLKGNEAVLGLNMLDPTNAGNREAILSRELGHMVMGGPFVTVQGRQALVGRLPVFLRSRQGEERQFWGLVSVTLKYPEAFEGTTLATLESLGYQFELWRVNPDDGRRQTILHSQEPPLEGDRYLERPLDLYSARWWLRLSPFRLWYEQKENWGLIFCALLVSLLVGFLTHSNISLKRFKRELESHSRRLRATARRAEEASRLKSAFLANMSHEIRTPMNGIIGFAELAIDEESVPDKTRRYLGNIKSSAEGLLQIINDILDISKIEAGKIELEKTPFKLFDVFVQCETIIAPKVAEKNLKLLFNASPPVTRPLLGDPTKLRQIILNLLSNSIKFTPAGAVKFFSTLESSTAGGVTLNFEVSDSGIGMTQEQIDKVFEPFAQADSSTTRKFGGTGLGLAITKNLIELMGGQLKVESRPGLGSKFSFDLTFEISDLPAEAVSVPGGSGVRGLVKPTFRGEVLVCEDNLINQEVITEHLSNVGLSCQIAANGRVGVEMAAARMAEGQPYDLILMDIHMPEMDGLEAARRLALLDNPTPIVALTANVMAADREKYKEYQMPDCLGKPFQAQELWAILMKYLPQVEPDPEAGEGADEADGRPLLSGLARSRVINYRQGLEQAAANEKLYARLLNNFHQDNQTKGGEMEEALAAGDEALARRLAHTLKGVAGMIGAQVLAKAAWAVEEALADGLPGEARKKLPALEKELAAVLADLRPYCQPVGGTGPAAAAGAWDRERAGELIARLAPLLEAGETECLGLVEEIREVLGPAGELTVELITQMEEYDFEMAGETLGRIKGSLEG